MSEENWEIKAEEAEESKIGFEVTVPEPEVEKVREKALQELQQEVEEPGFRKGKVPAGIIENKYSAQLLHSMAEKLVPIACTELYQRENLRPVASPEIKDFKFEDGFYLKGAVEVLPEPEVEPADYIGLELESSSWEVEEEAVEEQLEKIRKQASVMKPVEITRPVADGDFVKADIKGFDKNNTPIPGTSEEGVTLEVGGDSTGILADIGEGLIGAQVGENRRVPATFNEEMIDENLAGQEVFFEVDVREIKVQEVPELDNPDFLDERGFESVEEFREKVRNNLAEVSEDNRKQELVNQVYANLLEKIDFEIPEKMLQSEQEDILEKFKQQLQMRGQSLDDYLAHSDHSREELLEDMRPEAERRIKVTLITQAIAESEEIELSDEEFSEYLEDWLGQANLNMSVEEFLEQFEGEKVIGNIKYEGRQQKVLDYLIDQAEVKEKQEENGET